MFHVYDVKSSHKDTKAVDNFEQRIEFTYGYKKIGKIISGRGKFYEYFPMILDYTTKVDLKIDIRNYVKNMIGEFPRSIENPRD